jgi:hypothetical protein
MATEYVIIKGTTFQHCITEQQQHLCTFPAKKLWFE